MTRSDTGFSVRTRRPSASNTSAVTKAALALVSSNPTIGQVQLKLGLPESGVGKQRLELEAAPEVVSSSPHTFAHSHDEELYHAARST
jgi:hypothetical protein